MFQMETVCKVSNGKGFPTKEKPFTVDIGIQRWLQLQTKQHLLNLRVCLARCQNGPIRCCDQLF